MIILDESEGMEKQPVSLHCKQCQWDSANEGITAGDIIDLQRMSFLFTGP